MDDVYGSVMQRWIVLGVVAMVLAIGGSAFGYRAIKQNRPAPIWVPLAMNTELPYEKRREIAKELKLKLEQKEVLLQVCKDLSLAQEWQLPSNEAAAEELGKRLFVDLGDMDTPTGKVPSVNVGVRGKLKEKDTSGKIAMRMMDDVWKILGIEPPPKN
jgi:ribosomal protein L39E